MKKGLIYLMGAMVLLVVSCTKSVEELKLSWAEENLELEGLKVEYNRYGTFITEVQENAKIDYEAALAISEEEKQRDALKLSIKKLNTGVVLKLNKVIELKESLDNSLRYIRVSFSEDEYGFKTYDEVQEAKKAIRYVQNIGHRRTLSTSQDALVELNLAINKIKEPSQFLKNIVAQHKAKVRAAKAQAKAARKAAKANSGNVNTSSNSSSATTTPATPVAKQVKCAYCGVKQADGSSCKKCGAKL